MPTPDLGPDAALARLRERQRTAFMRRLSGPGRKPPDDGFGVTNPVGPDRPLDLSGGAAAALEFDD